MPERCLRALARFIARRPGAVAAVGIVLAVVGALAAARMPVKSDLLDAFPEGKPSLTAFSRYARDFGMLDGLVVVIRSPGPAPDRLIAAADAIGDRLAASPLIASVDFNAMRSGSRLVATDFPAWLDSEGVRQLDARLTPEGIRRQMARNRDALLAPFASPLASEVIAGDPLGLREIVRDSMLRRPLPGGIDRSTGYYMDSGRTAALVMARPRGSSKDMAFVGALFRDTARIVAEAREDIGDATLSIGITGGYARVAEEASAIWRDMVVSFVVSFVLVLGAIWFSFRPTLRVLAVLSICLFAALSWTMLLAHVLYGALNIVTSIVAAMLIGMYVDYLILVYARFEECLRETGDRAAALETTLAGTGKAVVTSALTTSVSFFAVVVTSFRGLHELGVVTGFGVLLCLVASLALAPALLSLIARDAPGRIAAGRIEGIGTGWAQRLVEKRGRAVRAGFACACVAAAGLCFAVRFDTDLESLGLRDSSAAKVQRTIEERFGRGGEPLLTVARAADEAALARDFDAMERLGRALRASGDVGAFSSAGLLVPPPSAQEEARRALSARGIAGRWDAESLAAAVRGALRDNGMRADSSLPDYTRGIVSALSRDAVVSLGDLARSGDPRASYFYNPERHAIAAHMTSAGARWEPGPLQRVRNAVRAQGADFTLIGYPIIVDEIRSSIILESALALAISFFANIAIVRLHFRRWPLVVRAMLPVTAGSVLTVGAMGLLGVGFNFFNVAGLALISGFGVDYGIYLMQAHVEAGGCGGAEAVRRVGDRVALCAITTVFSCGSLVTTHYRGLASLGTVLSLGALFCLLSSILLLPATIDRAPGAGVGR